MYDNIGNKEVHPHDSCVITYFLKPFQVPSNRCASKTAILSIIRGFSRNLTQFLQLT